MNKAIYTVVTESIENAIVSISSAIEKNSNLDAYIFVDYRKVDFVNVYEENNQKIKFIDLNTNLDIISESNKLVKYIDFEENHETFFNINSYFIERGYKYSIYTHERNYHFAEFGDIYTEAVCTAAQMNQARHLKKITNKFIYSEEIDEKLFYNDKFMVFNLDKLVEFDIFNNLMQFVENYYYIVEEYDSKKIIEQYAFIDVFNQYLGKIHSHHLLLQNYFVETTCVYPYELPMVVLHQNLLFNYFGDQIVGFEEIRHNFYNVFAQLEFIEIILDYIEANMNLLPFHTPEVADNVRLKLEELFEERNAKYQEMVLASNPIKSERVL